MLFNSIIKKTPRKEEGGQAETGLSLRKTVSACLSDGGSLRVSQSDRLGTNHSCGLTTAPQKATAANRAFRPEKLARTIGHIVLPLSAIGSFWRFFLGHDWFMPKHHQLMLLIQSNDRALFDPTIFG